MWETSCELWQSFCACLWQVANVVEKLKDVDRNSFLRPVWSGEPQRSTKDMFGAISKDLEIHKPCLLASKHTLGPDEIISAL